VTLKFCVSFLMLKTSPKSTIRGRRTNAASVLQPFSVGFGLLLERGSRIRLHLFLKFLDLSLLVGD
jgi:hypothetical protein